MKIIIAGGTGFIGQYLVKHFLDKQQEITIIGRDKAKIKSIYNDFVTAVSWQELTSVKLSAADLLINLSGANIGEKRWDDKRKAVLKSSRIEPTEKLCQWLCQAEQKPVWLNASGVGAYGTQSTLPDDLPEALDETKPVQTPSFLSELSTAWEAATKPAADQGVRVVLLRFGAVIGANGGVLKKLKLPFQLGLGSTLGSGKQVFPWVALADLIKAIDFIYQDTRLSGPVNVVSPQAITQEQFAQALAQALKRPLILKMPEKLVKLMFGEMGEELLLQGQHAIPRKLLEAGFKFDYRTIQSALEHALSESRK